jgi:SAM-dependent methyltransferase
MAYYDRIARKWHAITGAQGGALKKHVLNERVFEKIAAIDDLAILELGAGNGYFLPLLLQRFAGERPSRVVITDQSRVLLGIARRNFRVPHAGYCTLDIRAPFPFAGETFDLILASMLFNELGTGGLHQAVRECGRVLRPAGRLIATATHPRFVESLARRGLLRRSPEGLTTMPGSDGLRLPVVQRTTEEYCAAFRKAGFRCCWEDVFPTPDVLRAKPGLREAGRVPLAILFGCEKSERQA